jgi:hypothetical protein
MIIDRAEIKAEAKAAISKSRPNAILVALVYIIITYVLEYLTLRVMGYDGTIGNMLDEMARGRFDYSYSIEHRPMGPLLSIAISIMDMMLSAGLTIYLLNISRMKQASFGNLFDSFGMFFRILWLNILMGIFVFLWTLLFIIPGIVALYRYRQALYLLLDNPHMTAFECITASKQLMRGRKGELFVLDLSFIGWWILTMIPFVSLWVTPYAGVTYANYYNRLLWLHNGGSGGTGGDGYGQDGQNRGGNGSGGRPPWEF